VLDAREHFQEDPPEQFRAFQVELARGDLVEVQDRPVRSEERQALPHPFQSGLPGHPRIESQVVV
jgi:hypothetical protein